MNGMNVKASKRNRNSNYAELLNDVRWQKKRLECFDKSDWSCSNCGEDTKQLHVHHAYYEFGKAPWEYPDDCLIVLCEMCHKAQPTRETKARFMREIGKLCVTDSQLSKLCEAMEASESTASPDDFTTLYYLFTNFGFNYSVWELMCESVAMGTMP